MRTFKHDREIADRATILRITTQGLPGGGPLLNTPEKYDEIIAQCQRIISHAKSAKALLIDTGNTSAV